MSGGDTIVACATPPGPARRAILRLSGPRAGALVRAVLRAEQPAFEARVARALHQGRFDDGVGTQPVELLWLRGPRTYTREDLAEFHLPGAAPLVRAAERRLCALGAVPARPGEFTRRAFLNGKLDLAQAEGLADLIDAETASQHAQAMRQLGGTTTRRVEALRGAILEPLALMEAYIDFPDEEIPEEVLTEVSRKIEKLKHDIADILDDNGIGEKIREGLDIVILGPPNAGKSSLLNVLAKRDAAIVSPEAGTTRDLIEVPMEIGGYAVTLVDTAGIREASGTIESEGIRRALHRAQHADITLRLCDVTTIAESSSKLATERDKNTLLVVTKTDLAPLPQLPFPALAISTRTGDGIEALIAALKEKIEERMESVASPLITRARHRAAMGQARDALTRFDAHAPLELSCEELRLAAAAIGKITGKIWVDDVLDLVFSRFCIGK